MVMSEAPAALLHPSIAHVAKPSAAHAHTHTQYLIRVADARSPGLHWTVYRRYSEFRAFKLKLEAAVKRGDMCAHCAIMAKRTCFMMFPPRRLFGNLKESTLEKRRVGLNAFLDAVARHARACSNRAACQTRPLMDQFLMVNDMRYTYLNVNMGDAGEDDHGLPFKAGEQQIHQQFPQSKRAMTPNSIRSSTLASRLNRLSYSDSRDEHSRSMYDAPANSDVIEDIWRRRHELNNNNINNDDDNINDNNNNTNNQEEAPGPQEDLAQQQEQVLEKELQQVDDSPAEFEGRLFKAPRKSGAPHLLRYTNERRSRTSSWNDDASSAQPATSSASVSAQRPHSISDWDSAKQQMAPQQNPRHSDPGSRLDLLSLPRGSFGGGVRRSENGRPRHRKVHLSSAAKRIKRLEEQEAKFGSQRPERRRRVPALPTIPEE